MFSTHSRYKHQPTSITDWTKSDEYHNAFLVPADTALDAVMQHTQAEGLPAYIAVSKAQGRFLGLVAKSVRARRVLEVGTLGGYSTVCFARALPEGGKVVTLEVDAHHVKVAQENFKTAGVEHLVDVIEGPAAETLPTIQPKDDSELFDLAFIDADKENNVIYFEEAKRLVRRGGVIIVDNVIRYGRVSDLAFDHPNDVGVRKLLEKIQGDKEVDATTVGTAGERGWDGFIYAVRN
ncbi:O-methyltransferase family 3 protein [Pholiota conissans]|uniref:O-methyltransferase family 3 protein n=1 Tax=Pholiota conissans TaxID=109636 RepID=A0A9P6D5X2_9AGAR|nr:O-methyltransferase family 3 protein [Pholiota conissans]